MITDFVEQIVSSVNKGERERLAQALLIDDWNIADKLNEEEDPASWELAFFNICLELQVPKIEILPSWIEAAGRLDNGSPEQSDYRTFIQTGDHSDLLSRLLDRKRDIDKLLYGDASQAVKRFNGHDPEKIVGLLNRDENLRQIMHQANSGLNTLWNEYPYLRFGKEGAFSPVSSVRKVNDDGSFSYKRYLMGHTPVDSLSPAEVFTHNLRKEISPLEEAKKIVKNIVGGSNGYHGAEVSAALAMLGHYNAEHLENPGVFLFLRNDAMNIAAYMVHNIAKERKVDYPTVAAIGITGVKEFSDLPYHQKLIGTSRSSIYFLIDHLLTRLIDAEVLSTSSSANGMTFRLHEKYQANLKTP